MRKSTLSITGAVLALMLVAASVSAGNGPPAPAFYVDGVQYGTIATPTDLSGTGAPAHSFDIIYDLGDASLLNVAEAAPGDRDYNGGRWMVFAITWNVAPFQLTSAEQVLALEASGDLAISDDPVKQFVCPVIPLRGG